MFRRALELDTENFSAYVGLGNCYMLQEDYQKAEEAFGKALKIEPNNNDLLNLLEECHGKLSLKLE